MDLAPLEVVEKSGELNLVTRRRKKERKKEEDTLSGSKSRIFKVLSKINYFEF